MSYTIHIQSELNRKSSSLRKVLKDILENVRWAIHFNAVVYQLFVVIALSSLNWLIYFTTTQV